MVTLSIKYLLKSSLKKDTINNLYNNTIGLFLEFKYCDNVSNISTYYTAGEM